MTIFINKREEIIIKNTYFFGQRATHFLVVHRMYWFSNRGSSCHLKHTVTWLKRLQNGGGSKCSDADSDNCNEERVESSSVSGTEEASRWGVHNYCQRQQNARNRRGILQWSLTVKNPHNSCDIVRMLYKGGVKKSVLWSITRRRKNKGRYIRICAFSMWIYGRTAFGGVHSKK